jgi:HD-GYP domain-containing protein (c-di-GMP phosphodiesterase class II)
VITRDEAQNLKISRGTLTDSERHIIQNHVVMTIKMLKQIPYPKYLKEVPEIAGKHHERIDGKGYPLGLTGDQMSLRAKILAVADIFEALTAPDRPYKDVMRLSRALSIMDNLAKEGHIDKDVWKIFLLKKVYLEYGRDHLKPDQLDVD